MREKGHCGRPLRATERALFTVSQLSPLNLVVLVSIDGPAVSGVLADALAALQRRHPLLCARIVGPLSRPRFELSQSATCRIPLRLVQAAKSGQARAEETGSSLTVAEAEMNAPFEPAVAPLARLTCVSGPGPRTSLILTLHHAIADGVSAANLVHELLDGCHARLTGAAELPTARTAVPPAAADLVPVTARSRVLTFAARETLDELGSRLAGRTGQRAIPAPGQAVARVADLSPEDTRAVVDRSRRQRLTMTSVLAAGLLWQASAVLHSGRPVPMRAVIWVDLRPYLNPAPSAEALGCYISMIRFSVRVDPRRGFAALAADVQARIRRASRRVDPIPAAQLSAAMTRFAVRWPVSRLGTVALSYGTTSAIRTSYGPLAVREVRAFVSNNRIGAEVAAVCAVHHGVLRCDLLYLDSDYDRATAALIGDGLLATLRDFAGRG
jgi:hypothetical protein